MNSVFLSYARQDVWIMRAVKRVIEETGLPVWYDTNLTAGEPWAEELQTAINSALCIVVLLTRNSARHWIRVETLQALEAHKHIIPVIADGDDDVLPFELKPFEAIDLRNDYSAGCTKLIANIQNYAEKKGVSKSPIKMDVDVVPPPKIYKDGIIYLGHKSNEDLLIFSPTGVWEHDEDKEKWFWTIAYCLTNGLSDLEERQVHKKRLNKYWRKAWEIPKPSTALKSFIGIYGLPLATNESSKAVDEKQTQKNTVDYMEETLLLFDGIRTAQIYYLDADLKSLSGNGAILIDRNLLYLGFCTHRRHKIDYGFSILNQPTINEQVQNWFFRYLLNSVQPNTIQLIDGVREKKASQGMAELREKLGC